MCYIVQTCARFVVTDSEFEVPAFSMDGFRLILAWRNGVDLVLILSGNL
jgi:hypothetical protein